MPGFGALFKTRTQQWNLSHTWTLGPNAVNEFRFNYFREGQGNLDHPLNILPSVHDACGPFEIRRFLLHRSRQSRPPASPPTFRAARVYLVFWLMAGFPSGTTTKASFRKSATRFSGPTITLELDGKHTMKFGADVRRQRFDQFLYFNINGFSTFLSDSNLCAPINPNSSVSLRFAHGPKLRRPHTNDVGFTAPIPIISWAPQQLHAGGRARTARSELAFYLFAQDSWKIRTNLTLNYGLRWELNTPYYDTGNRLQTFRPGEATTQYPCWMSAESSAQTGLPAGNCGPGSGNESIFPYGLVFPGDKGVPRGLTSTYYRAFAPRIGLAWSPAWTGGWLAKLTGGPGKSSVRAGYGIFYNPIEQLVLEQFSGEPPFGGSTSLTNTLFNLPFEAQSGGSPFPNPYGGIHPSDTEHALRLRHSGWTSRLRRLVAIPPHSARRRISAAPEVAVRRAIQPHHRAPAFEGHASCASPTSARRIIISSRSMISIPATRRPALILPPSRPSIRRCFRTALLIRSQRGAKFRIFLRPVWFGSAYNLPAGSLPPASTCICPTDPFRR